MVVWDVLYLLLRINVCFCGIATSLQQGTEHNCQELQRLQWLTCSCLIFIFVLHVLVAVNYLVTWGHVGSACAVFVLLDTMWSVLLVKRHTVDLPAWPRFLAKLFCPWASSMSYSLHKASWCLGLCSKGYLSLSLTFTHINNYFLKCTHRRESVNPPLYRPPLYCLNVSHIICGLKNCWLISHIFQYIWVSFADFSILYIQSFVYTVYDELTGQRQGPGPSGKSITCCHSHITTTETDTGEQPAPTTWMWSKHSQRQNTSVHTVFLGNKASMHSLLYRAFLASNGDFIAMIQSHIIRCNAVQSTMTALYVLIDSQSSNWNYLKI